MTIADAIKRVLDNNGEGLTSGEIYQKIIAGHLYEFPAKNPEAVVNNIIRRHCLGLDFPTASAVKHFKIVSYKGKKPCYSLVESSGLPAANEKSKVADQSEMLPEEKIQLAYDAHVATIEFELNRQIMNNHSSFF